MRGVFNYLSARFNERSTWSDIIAGCAAAAVLPEPWSYASMAAAVIKALVPDGPVKEAAK